jgi:hypothetical protein
MMTKVLLEFRRLPLLVLFATAFFRYCHYIYLHPLMYGCCSQFIHVFRFLLPFYFSMPICL